MRQRPSTRAGPPARGSPRVGVRRLLGRLAAALALVVALLVAGAARAAPTNDDFRDAFAVPSLPATVREPTVDATLERHEPQPPCAPLGATVWFRFAPART